MFWIKLKYRLAFLFREILFELGMKGFLLRDRFGVCILVFHGIDDEPNVKLNSRFISKHYFEVLMQYLSDRFHLISISDVFARRLKPGTLNIAVTFDDGYRNNYLYAVPVLKRLHIPASFFVTAILDDSEMLWPDFLDLVTFYSEKREIVFEGLTFTKNRRGHFINGSNTLKSFCRKINYSKIKVLFKIFDEEWKNITTMFLDNHWKLMDESEIRSISEDPLFTIGGHGVRHVNLNKIADADAWTEINLCKARLEKIVGKVIEEFAFPFGSYNQQLLDYGKDAGFTRLLLADCKENILKRNVTVRRRFVINPHLSMKHQVACMMSGSYFSVF